MDFILSSHSMAASLHSKPACSGHPMTCSAEDSDKRISLLLCWVTLFVCIHGIITKVFSLPHYVKHGGQILILYVPCII